MSEHKRTIEEIIPVIEENLIIGTERATTETVRVRTVIHEDEHAIDEPITITDVEVKRVAIDLWTDEPIPARRQAPDHRRPGSPAYDGRGAAGRGAHTAA